MLSKTGREEKEPSYAMTIIGGRGKKERGEAKLNNHDQGNHEVPRARALHAG